MKGLRQLVFRTTPDRIRSFVFCVALGACFVGHFDPAFAQAPPQGPPATGALPTGSGALSLGQWLLTPTLGLYTLYNSNIYSSPTSQLSGPAFHINPILNADYNTGIYDTKLNAYIDSMIYPTLDYINNTFNRGAGVTQTYSPLPDLVFTAQGNYAYSTLANVFPNSTPVVATPTPPPPPGTPPPVGAAAVVAGQQTFVNPNETYTAVASVYKQFNRAFMQLSASVLAVEYVSQPASNSQSASYNASGGFWFSPLFYAFGNASESTVRPVIGASSSYHTVQGGIGSDRISLFQGSIYFGYQGSEVADGGGTAGGDLYGASISYFPTEVWTLFLSASRITNVSNITSQTSQVLSGLQLAAIAISTSQSVQTTSVSIGSNYTLSPQTTLYALVSDTRIEDPLVNNSWLASAGITHKLSDQLSLSFTYSYTRYISPTPLTSFTDNVATVGALYRF